MRRKERLPHRRWLFPIHPALFAGWVGKHNSSYACPTARGSVLACKNRITEASAQ